MNENDIKIHRFTITGGFDVNKKFKETLNDCDGKIGAFKLPDGRRVRLCVALEVESEDGYEYITSEEKMAKLGFECLDYDEVYFSDAEIIKT